jgi:hypothetical protein
VLPDGAVDPADGAGAVAGAGVATGAELPIGVAGADESTVRKSVGRSGGLLRNSMEL